MTSPPPDLTNPDATIRDWAIARFHESESDTRWAKERASNITYWSAVLSVAIVAVIPIAHLKKWAAITLILLQSAVAVLWVSELHEFARETSLLVGAAIVAIASVSIG